MVILHKTILGNGLKVVVREVPYIQTVTASIWVNQGGKDENENNNGISHLIEHLLFTPRNFKGELVSLFEDLTAKGALMNAVTGKEFTQLFMCVTKENISTMLKSLLFIFKDTNRITKKAVNDEKKIVLHELQQYYKSSRIIYELFSQSLWGEASLGNIVIGKEEVVSGLKYEETMNQIKKEYIPDNSLLCIVGNVDVDETMTLIGEIFNSLEGPVRNKADYTVEVQPNVIMTPTEIDKVQFIIGVEGVDYYDPDKYVLKVVSKILGGGLNSRLYQEIREKRGLAYDISVYTTNYKNSGAFACKITCNGADFDKVLELVLNEFIKLKNIYVSKDELESAKQMERTEILMSFEHSFNQMKMIGRAAMLGQDFSMDDYVRRIQNVSQEDVQRVARKIFQTERLAFSCIGRIDTEELFKNLHFD